MSDFTFKELLTGILKFNDENVMHIGFNADTEDIIITNWNAAADTAKTLQTNLNGGGGSAVLGQKTITVNGTYDASDDSLDGYDQVTVNVPVPALGTKSITENGTYAAASDNLGGYSEVTVNVPSGITIDEFATNAKPTGAVSISAASVESDAFASRNITSISAPNCTEIKYRAFAHCSSLTSVSFPLVTSLTSGQYVFDGCSNLTDVNLPGLTGESGVRTFNSCTSLAMIDLANCSNITQQCFNGCTLLRTIVLRSSTVASLGSWNAATLGGIYSNAAASTIYVPESLISSYQTASNWSAAYAAGVTFAKIEGSAFE